MHKIIQNQSALFWRIFALVWLANITIAASAGLLIALDLEKEKQDLIMERRMERSAMRIVDQYEKTGETVIINNKSLGRYYELIDPTRDIALFGEIPDKLKTKANSFNIESPQGKTYQVNYVALPHKTEIWIAAKSRLSPLRIALTLCIVSLFSALITSVVTQPIKKLRTHVKRLSTGDLETRVNEQLTNRQDEIGQLANSINAMSERIGQLIHDKQQLLYDVSHELKAPLARMQVANAISAQVALDHELSDKNHNQVDKDITHLTNMIDELLSLARIEHAPESAITERVNIGDLLNEEKNNQLYVWPNRQIHITADNVEITTNKKLLLTAINNLLGNALKHSDGDIEMSAKIVNQTCELKIMDNGAGVPEEKLADLFRPFVRGDTNAKGFGLGLAITAKSIDRIKGNINAVNKEPTGLSITIKLPLTIT